MLSLPLPNRFMDCRVEPGNDDRKAEVGHKRPAMTADNKCRQRSVYSHFLSAGVSAPCPTTMPSLTRAGLPSG